MTASFTRLVAWMLICGLFVGSLGAETSKRGAKRKTRQVVQDADSTPQHQSDLAPDPSASQQWKQDVGSGKSSASPNATVLPSEIIEYSGELPRVRKLIESALVLTTQDLTYTYGSDDPANGGMDCSGFISYVLKKNGFSNVPRDASSQYIWLRKSGAFRAVLSQNSGTFELDDLHPGDLLFWTGTYGTAHDPPVTHSMIYLGTEKGTKNKIMVGASNGRSYHGKSRWGVSVFDFHLSGSSPSTESKPTRSTFVGYARPPGLRD